MQALSKKERERLISKIAYNSGIAKYALEKKLTDEQVLEASDNVHILKLIKKANTYNRNCQAQNTEEANKKAEAANAKLKEFMNLENSEIYKLGKWLIHSLSKTGQERQSSLLENNLVHKDDYNQLNIDLSDTIKSQQEGMNQQTNNAGEIIVELEKTNDSLRQQLSLIQNYISHQYSVREWKQIVKYIEPNIRRNS